MRRWNSYVREKCFKNEFLYGVLCIFILYVQNVFAVKNYKGKKNNIWINDFFILFIILKWNNFLEKLYKCSWLIRRAECCHFKQYAVKNFKTKIMNYLI